VGLAWIGGDPSGFVETHRGEELADEGQVLLLEAINARLDEADVLRFDAVAVFDRIELDDISPLKLALVRLQSEREFRAAIRGNDSFTCIQAEPKDSSLHGHSPRPA
jgi:hypothetical protein